VKYTKGEIMLVGSKFKTGKFDVVENVRVQILIRLMAITTILKSGFPFTLIYLNIFG
jgi:hypothetical protein